VAAAQRAAEAGFDLLALDMAHGYLLGSFISPLTNQRMDAYGGAAEKRARFPLEVFKAVRAVWPEERPMAAALNAADRARGGVEIEEVIELTRRLKEQSCDLIRPLAGQTTTDLDGGYGPDSLIAYSERLRNEARIATLAGGGITTTNQANSILAGGRADLILMDLRMADSK
jgi:anthraniloyl-CoA monooxygenase